MKKALLFVGSKAEDSITLKIGEKIIENINKISKDKIDWTIYTSKDLKIKSCVSCNLCFQTGICMQEKKDDMELLKHKLIESDFIMLGSPVFAHNVSGDMKIFIDRISYWMHMFKLAGRKAFIFSSCGTNGIDAVTHYLNKCSTYLGLDVVGYYNAVIYDKKNISNIDFLNKEIQLISKSIYREGFLKECLKATRMQENIFIQYRNHINSINNEEKSFLYKYWEGSGMLKSDSFQDYLDKLNK